MKYLTRVGADILFVLHFFIVMIVLFGWILESIWYFYMATLIITLIFDLIFNYCFISKWEFVLRKILNSELNYNYNWTSFYTHKFANKRLSDTFIKRIALFFLITSIIINLYFHYLY